MFSNSFVTPGVALSLLHFTLCVNGVAAASSDPSITISTGVVVGSTDGQVNSFLGVPFANPPLRFAPPEPISPWTHPLVAQSLPPACIQQFSGPEAVARRAKQYFNNPYHDPPKESEDCLYLNVYAPANVSPPHRKAVLFWLFGGNLQFGTGSLAYYDGSTLASNEDVVVVTINYRTNIFGFSNSPEIPFGRQNAGFLDQRLALQWVQKNIAHFGGDPERVTIFGESAGAYSAMQLLANPPEPLPFSGVILQSLGLRLLGNSTNNYGTVASHFNCSNATSTLACLREVPATSLKSFIEANEIDFAPVDGDGTHTQDFTPSIMERTLAHVPIMIGSNSNEGSIFLRMIGWGEGKVIARKLLARVGSGSGYGLLDFLRQRLAIGLDWLYHLGDRILTNGMYTCPTSLLATQLGVNGYRTWQYYYSAAFPSVELFPDCGAYHSAEIPLIFGTYTKSHGHELAPELQHRLSEHMQHIWASFAKQEEIEDSLSATQLGFELMRFDPQGGRRFNTTDRRPGDPICTICQTLVKPLRG